MGISRDRQDQVLQMLEEKPTMEGSQARQEQMLKGIQADSDAQKQLFQQLMAPADEGIQDAQEAPMMAQSREHQDEYLGQLEAERATQEKLLQAMVDQASRKQTVDLQNGAEAGLMRASRARQDKIVNQIVARRHAQAQARARTRMLQSSETRLRALAQEELAAGLEASKAADRNDRQAYDAAGKKMEPMFKERSQLFDKIRKADPKKADALYDELYVNQPWIKTMR